MKVTNSSSIIVHVSISTWGDNGSPDWYKLDPGGYDSWTRPTLPQGYLMAMYTEHNGVNGEVTPYFIYSDSSIYIYNDRVEEYLDNANKVIYPATQRYGC